MVFKSRSIRALLAGTAIFIASCVCGYGASAPAPAAAPTVDLSVPSGGGGAVEATQAAAPTSAAAAPPTELPLVILPTATAETPSQPGAGAPAAVIPETRRLTLEYPPQIRSGDSDVIRLTLEVDTLGNVTPTAEIQGHAVTGQTVEIPNLYDTHSVIAEARLDLAGVEVRPSEDVSEPLMPGESVSFFWSVHPTSTGTYRGTVWLFLHFIDKTTKEESRKALSAQTVQIASTDFLGLNGSVARITGGLGSVVGAVLGLPFADEILKWLWKRIRRGA